MNESEILDEMDGCLIFLVVFFLHTALAVNLL